MKLRITLFGFVILGSLALLGCKEDNYGLVEANPKKVIAVVKSLNNDEFERLNHVEKSQALDIVTKVHSVEYLIAPDQVALEIPQQPEYEVALFKLHETPEVVAFLAEEFNRHLDAAPKTMAEKDNKVRGREQRLINLLSKQYVQALIVEKASDPFRTYLEAAGTRFRQDDPYILADSALVHAAGTGYVQKYLEAARENDDAKMKEYRAKINEVLEPLVENTIDYEAITAAALKARAEAEEESASGGGDEDSTSDNATDTSATTQEASPDDDTPTGDQSTDDLTTDG